MDNTNVIKVGSDLRNSTFLTNFKLKKVRLQMTVTTTFEIKFCITLSKVQIERNNLSFSKILLEICNEIVCDGIHICRLKKRSQILLANRK